MTPRTLTRRRRVLLRERRAAEAGLRLAGNADDAWSWRLVLEAVALAERRLAEDTLDLVKEVPV